MKMKSLVVAAALVAAAVSGCKKKKTNPEASAPPGVVKTETSPVAVSPEAPAAPAATMDKLKATGAGWEGEYNPNLQSWTFEKYTPNSEGTNDPNRLYINTLDEDKPTTADAYAAKITEKDFEDFGFQWTEVADKTALPDGFVITGKVIATGEADAKPEPSFLVVRKLGGAQIVCKSGTLTSDALRAEAIELCKSASF